MKTLPKHFQLHSEEPSHYVIIDTRDNKTFPVAKHALDLDTHAKLSKIKRFEKGGKVKGYSDGTPDEPVESDDGGDSSDTQGADDSAPSSPVTVNVNSAPMAPAVQPPPIAASPVASSAPVAPQIVRAPAMAANAPLVRQAQAAQALTERGTQEQATAEAQASSADAQALQDHTTKMQSLMDGVAEKRKALDTENAQLTQAVMNQNIDPNRYWHNKSLPGKISTAIGVILAGIGAGLQHSTTNQAMEVVQNAIRQDVDAQKANLGKKQSLLSMNMEKYRNLDAATTATIAQMNAMVEGQLKLNAAKSGSQRAQAAADLAIGTNRMKYISELPNLAMADYKASLLNGGSSGPSAAQRILNPNAGQTAQALGPPAPTGQEGTQVTAPPQDPDILSPNQIDMNRIGHLKAAGLIDDKDFDKVREEISGVQQGARTKALIKNQFNQMQDAMTKSNAMQKPEKLSFMDKITPFGKRAMGPVDWARAQDIVGELPFGIGKPVKEMNAWGGELGSRFQGARNTALLLFNTLMSKRISPEAIEKLKVSLPEGNETPGEMQTKLQRMYDAIDRTTQETPTLDSLDKVYNLTSRRK